MPKSSMAMLDAHRPQLVGDARGAAAARQRAALGDLELEQLGLEALGGEHPRDPAGQLGVVEAARGEVDRHAQRRARRRRQRRHWASASRSTTSVSTPISPAWSASGTKPSGPIAAEVGVLPARERLDAGRAAARERELGLVLEHDLAGLDAAPQLGREQQAVDAVVVLGRRVDLHRPLRGLRAVQGDVGAAQQVVGVAAVLGVVGEADARAHVEHHAVEHEGVVERAHEPLGQPLAVLQREAGEEDGELVAAEAGERVVGAQGAAEPAADLLQEPVAVGVAEGVVDGLEVVEVDDHQHERLVGPARACARGGRAAARGWAAR